MKEVQKSVYYPIWPDDYIFFGQRLTFGYADSHQEVPTAVVRNGGRLSQDADANRVYRAPAYFRSKNMGMVHFNPNVYLAQKEKLTTEQIARHETPRDAYPGMTAIDFAGHQETNEVNGTYELGMQNGIFYQPLLDDDGLLSITNCDETRNLLVYAPAHEAPGEDSTEKYVNNKTYDVLSSYFKDPDFTDYYDNSRGYRLVRENTEEVNGHLVESDLTATNDHLLVDYEDFNAPISYTFDSSHRMWYQRTPKSSEFVDRDKGWQDISIPFTAELVTTHQKGEITHFYSGSETSKNGTGTKIGHEYWLRNLKGLEPSENSSVIVGNFTYPDATGSLKEVTNTFLWDYYYKNEFVHNQLDANNDTYQEYWQYYKDARKFASYPRLANATPYILGLPGETYYEFDLSGIFGAENIAKDANLVKLAKQTITFASAPNITIGVSDNELNVKPITIGGKTFTYRPSYMNWDFTESDNAYALNNEGNAYNKIAAKTTVGAFRPYFIEIVPSSSRSTTRSIVFGNKGDTEMPHPTDKPDAPGTLTINAGEHKIIVASDLKREATVNIYSTTGAVLRTFDIKPGETIETRIINAGVYIVQTTDGKFLKKLAVR